MSSDKMTEFRQGAGLVLSADDTPVMRRLLTRVRDRLRNDPLVAECLTAETVEERRAGVLHSVAGMEMDQAHPRARELLEAAVNMVLSETEAMVDAGHRALIIDESTGMAVAPLTPGMIVKTPDYVGEDGVVRKGRKIVDPGFTSALGLARQEAFRTQSALARTASPAAYEHIRNPSCMLADASERLKAAGVMEPAEGDPVEEVLLEVGREQSDGVLQSPNDSFHRGSLYSEILARRILSRGAKACILQSIVPKSDTRHRWYEVKALLSPASDADASLQTR